MHRDGEYAVWFRTVYAEGTGIVFLDNGRITGGDSMFAYGGSYEIDGDRFTATLTIRRFAEGTTTVFGVDEVEARLTGRSRARPRCAQAWRDRRRACDSRRCYSASSRRMCRRLVARRPSLARPGS